MEAILKTESLTAAELAEIPSIKIRCDLQRATLAARRATGIRYGTAVAAGVFQVGVIAYAINRKGEPTGRGSVRVVADGMTMAEAAQYLDAIAIEYAA